MGNRSKIEYIINEEKRTVVAHMRYCKHDVIDIIEKELRKGKLEPGFRFEPIQYFINDTYRGKAVCSIDDEWDVEEGKRIARNRMLSKYYKAKKAAIAKFEASLRCTLCSLIKRTNYAKDRLEKAQDGEL